MRRLMILAAALLVASQVVGNDTSKIDAAAYRDVLRKIESIFAVEQDIRVEKRDWVHVHFGSPKSNEYYAGWRLDDAAGSVRILMANGRIVDFDRPDPGEKRPREGVRRVKAWEITVENFADYCRNLLKNYATDGKERRHFSAREVVEDCRLASWAFHRGEDKLAGDFLACAQNSVKMLNKTSKKQLDAVAMVATDVASRRRDLALSSARDGKTRAELQSLWQSIANIPAHEWRAEAKQLALGYQSLVAEDKVWVEPPPDLIDKLTTEERVNYWIYDLRDLCVPQFKHYARFQVVGRFRGLKNAPANAAEELAKLDIAAIPALIAHMDDVRPTRNIAYPHYHFGGGSAYLLRYGDCCQQIFESITGHTLYRGDSYPLKDGKGKECKERAEKWLRDYQLLGEEAMLKHGVEAGDRDSHGLAEKLIAKFPDAAPAAIAAGLRRCTADANRAAFVATIRELDQSSATPILLDELAGPDRDARIAAASILVDWKHTLGVVQLVKEWRSKSSKSNYWGNHHLLGPLIKSEDASAIRALATDWKTHELHDRFSAIQILHHAVVSDKAAGRAIEDVLVAALEDSESDGKSVADMAAQALAERLERPDLFDIGSARVRRDRQRVIVKNEWLVRNGQPPAPVPELATIKQLSPGEFRPLIDVWTKAQSPSEKSAAAAKIDALGLSALTALKALAGDTVLDGPTRAYVHNAQERFAATVREVHVPWKSLALPPELRRMADSMKGRPFDIDRFNELLRRGVGLWPETAAAFSLEIEREADEPGIILTVEYHPGAAKTTGKRNLMINESLSSQNSGHGAGSTRLDSGKADDARKDLQFILEDPLRRALAGNPEIALRASVRYSLRNP